MISLKYDPSNSSKRLEHYNFIDNEHCCTIVTARLQIPIKFLIYHDRKEIAFYHVYDDDINIIDELFDCIYEMSEILGIEDYDINETTNGNICYIKYIQRRNGVDYENYR